MAHRIDNINLSGGYVLFSPPNPQLAATPLGASRTDPIMQNRRHAKLRIGDGNRVDGGRTVWKTWRSRQGREEHRADHLSSIAVKAKAVWSSPLLRTQARRGSSASQEWVGAISHREPRAENGEKLREGPASEPSRKTKKCSSRE